MKKVYEIVRLFGPIADREVALERLEEYSKQNPALRYVMALNEGKIDWPGIPKDHQPHIIHSDKSEYGKNLNYYVKTRSAWEALQRTPEHKNFSPEGARRVLHNVANSIPYEEFLVLMTAFRGELINAPAEKREDLDYYKYSGSMSILKEVEAKKTVKQESDSNASEEKEETVVEAVQAGDVLLEKKDAKPEGKKVYANPENKNQVWKGRGAKPKWLKELLEDGVDIETLAVYILEE